jgi:hypothetical protein
MRAISTIRVVLGRALRRVVGKVTSEGFVVASAYVGGLAAVAAGVGWLWQPGAGLVIAGLAAAGSAIAYTRGRPT